MANLCLGMIHTNRSRWQYVVRHEREAAPVHSKEWKWESNIRKQLVVGCCPLSLSISISLYLGHLYLFQIFFLLGLRGF